MHVDFDDTLITGNKMIDGQHRELIGRINDLLAKCEERADKVGAVKMLDYLADYTDFHFKEEEKLQEELQYPAIEEHKQKHEEFRQTVKELYEMLEDQEGPTDDFVRQVNQKVVEWLFFHIKGYDRSVAEYKFLRSNNERL